MPSFARTLGLMLVFVGPLGLAAQPPYTPPTGWPNTTQSAGAYQQNFQRPAGDAARPNFYPSKVHPAAYQAPVSRDPVPGDPVPGNPPSASPSGTAAPIPLAPRNSRLPLKSPPSQSERREKAAPDGLTSMVTVIGSLAVVLGIFFLVAWGMRRVAPAGKAALPGEVFEVLGRAPMANRQQVHLLRCGRKLLLVSVTPTGTETLTEIVDAVEVDRLAGLCRQSHPGSATEAFRQVFHQFAPQRPKSGRLSGLFAGSDPAADDLGRRTAPSGSEDQNG